MPHSVQAQINATSLSIETGKVAKQADGAVVVRTGGTMVLSTVVAARSAMEGPVADGNQVNIPGPAGSDGSHKWL
jgi:polyribonucleotide nucleotidyltransferase